MGQIQGGYRGPDIVGDGLVLYLDAGSPNSYRREYGDTWRDISGNGKNGTLTGGPTFSNTNEGNFIFDGTNDSVKFSIDTGNLGLSTGATMECWINWTALSRWTGMFVFFTGTNAVDLGWDIDPDNRVRLWVWPNVYGSTAAWSILSHSGLWRQYTFVFTQTNASFYVNAVLLNQQSYSSTTIPDNNRLLEFGDHWDNPLQGNAAILRIYNRGLSATEITQNYNANKSRFGL